MSTSPLSSDEPQITRGFVSADPHIILPLRVESPQSRHLSSSLPQRQLAEAKNKRRMMQNTESAGITTTTTTINNKQQQWKATQTTKEEASEKRLFSSDDNAHRLTHLKLNRIELKNEHANGNSCFCLNGTLMAMDVDDNGNAVE